MVLLALMTQAWAQSQGAEPASRPAGRDETIKVQVGERTRTCLVHLPPAWDGNRPLPVVIAMHGAGGNGAGMAASTGFSALADEKGFVIAYPQGMGGWSALFGKPIPGGHGAQTDDVDDVGFIRTLIDRLRESYHVDPARLYACGHSSGAYMAYRVAIELSDRVAAVGVVNGSMGIRLLDDKPSIEQIPTPSTPISIIHVRGATDGIVKAEGGQTVRVLAKSANDCVQHFVKADGCDANGRETLDKEHGVLRTRYTGGKAGTEVEMVVVKKAGHPWPGPKEGFSTTEELWDFFSRHPRTTARSATSPAAPADKAPGAG
jgi:polyhydroxybutyrate depolymerase